MPHANGRRRPGTLGQRVRKGAGRRRSPKPVYHVQPGYARITGTIRKCAVHPAREAVLFRKNLQDTSYKVACCAECAA
jgi:hypothetical protein